MRYRISPQLLCIVKEPMIRSVHPVPFYLIKDSCLRHIVLVFMLRSVPSLYVPSLYVRAFPLQLQR